MDELKISKILVKKKWTDLSVDEEEQLEQWLASSPENKRIYKAFMDNRSWQERKHRLAGLDTDMTINKINAKLEHIRQIRRRRRITIAAAVAAMVVVTCFSVIFLNDWPADKHTQVAQVDSLYQMEKYYAILTVNHGEEVVLKNQETEWQQHIQSAPRENEKDTVRQLRIEVPKGKNYKVRLADSTLVWLNAETVLEYPERFTGNKRSVFLSGEAFFEVATNREKPFEIQNRDDVLIRVTGTQLNVSDYADEMWMKITLLEGVVHVGNHTEMTTLQPNQQAVIRRESGQLEVKTLEDASAAIAWIHGMFAFESESFRTVVEAIAKQHQLKVVYLNPDKLREGHLTFHASQSDTIEQLLEQLQLLTPFDYEISGDQLYIRF